jgi:hypothetical protein
MHLERVEDLQGAWGEQYRALVSDSQCAMFYHSLEFLRFLASFIEAEPLVLLCREEGRLVGALPTFIKHNAKTGSVLNSLPFFGSHGGPVVRNDVAEGIAKKAHESLLRHLRDEIWQTNDIAFSTIITTPYEKNLLAYERILDPQYVEHRTTQMVSMPERATEDELLGTFEKRCRGSIKKAVRERVSVKVLDTYDGNMIEQTYKMHVENAERIGAIPKPKAFLEQLTRFFKIHENYDVYIAEHAERVIGALLVFYFKGFVEYYMPAVRLEYRSVNPTNLMVLKAMSDAVSRGLSVLNFGGTGKTMRGVYMFKRSFRATDYEYNCLTNVLSDATQLLDLTPSDIRKAYEWFYVIPYSALSSAGSDTDSHHH